nr:hypothetical protein [Mesorhizobium loti]
MPPIKPAMGYVNVIQPDFHLHLKGGAVANWRREDDGEQVRFLAITEDGNEIGLAVSGARASFG